MLRREIIAVYCETHMKYTQYVRVKCSFLILNLELQRARPKLRRVKFNAGETGKVEQNLVHWCY